MKKKPFDPAKTRAYNHFPIDGEKPVISNLQFKEAMSITDNDIILNILGTYALDSTQKNLLKSKIK